MCLLIPPFNQWTFVSSGTSGVNYNLKIQNAATQFLSSPRYLNIVLNESNATHAIAVTDEDEPKAWSAKERDRKDVRR
jgi:hypothetical protein